MTGKDSEMDWWTDLQHDHKFQLENAAADLAVEVTAILHHALSARNDIDQETLAERLGVTSGRVSQVVNGDGNIHIATLAKYLRALGYEVRLNPRPVESSAPPLKRTVHGASKQPRKVEQFIHFFEAPIIDENGSSNAIITTVSASKNVGGAIVGNLTYRATFTPSGRVLHSSHSDVLTPSDSKDAELVKR